MQGEEFVLAIIAITMSAGVLIVGITKITELIKVWINRNDTGVNEDAFNRLAKAFMQHKKEMEQRMQNVEAIIADEDGKDHLPEIEAPQNKDILTNDLEQKNKVRS